MQGRLQPESSSAQHQHLYGWENRVVQPKPYTLILKLTKPYICNVLFLTRPTPPSTKHTHTHTLAAMASCFDQVPAFDRAMPMSPTEASSPSRALGF